MAVSRRPRPLAQAGSLMAALMLSATVSALPPPALGRPVRNGAPERAVGHAHHWPIYYPNLAHAGAAPSGHESVADALRREFLDHHTAMEYEQAAAVAARLQELAPGEAAAHYNRACALARLCRVDDSMAALRHAIECGWSDRLHLQIDPDLEILRRDPRFVALLERIPPTLLGEPPVKPSRPPAVALVHRGRVVMQWDEQAADAPLGAADLMRIASETWRLRVTHAALSRPAFSGAPIAPEPLVVFCASPELARELARLIEASGERTPILVRVASVPPAQEPGGPATVPATRPSGSDPASTRAVVGGPSAPPARLAA